MAGGLDFRRLQAVADLCAVAADGADALPDGAAALIHAHGCRFGETAETLALLAPVEGIAADPDAPGFAVANAVVLADSLQGGLNPQGLELNWTLLETAIRALPLRPRTAILTGFSHVAEAVQRMVGPDREDRISTDADAIMDALIPIAQRVDDATLISISRADYGNGAEQHLEALEIALSNPRGWRNADQMWYPSEVVELVSHVPETPGFLPMTALLLLDSVERADWHGNMDFRWSNNAAVYKALPDAVRPAILAGFRHLYETDDGWNPYLTAEFTLIEHQANTIPPVANAFLRADP